MTFETSSIVDHGGQTFVMFGSMGPVHIEKKGSCPMTKYCFKASKVSNRKMDIIISFFACFRTNIFSSFFSCLGIDTYILNFAESKHLRQDTETAQGQDGSNDANLSWARIYAEGQTILLGYVWREDEVAIDTSDCDAG